MLSQNEFVYDLVERTCAGGCGLKFKVLPTSKQMYGRSNCESYCKDRVKVEPVRDEVKIENKPEKVSLKKEVETVSIIESKQEILEPVVEVVKTEKKKVEKTDKKKTNVTEIDKLKNKSNDFRKNCFDSARKILSDKNSDDLSSCMSVVEIYKNFFNPALLNDFCKNISVSPEKFLSWVDVHSYIWGRVDYEHLSKYSIDELAAVAGKIQSHKSEDEIKKIIHEKIDAKYFSMLDSFDSYFDVSDRFFSRVDVGSFSKDQLFKIKDLIRRTSLKIRQFELEQVNGK